MVHKRLSLLHKRLSLLVQEIWAKKIKHPREKDDKTDNRCLRKQNKGQVLNQFLKVRQSKARDRRREKSTSNDRHVCTRCFGVWLK